MGAYTINAAIDGHASVLATVDTASMVLAQAHSALDEYDRVWVTDGLGRDIDLAQLGELAHRGQASEKPCTANVGFRPIPDIGPCSHGRSVTFEQKPTEAKFAGSEFFGMRRDDDVFAQHADVNRKVVNFNPLTRVQ